VTGYNQFVQGHIFKGDDDMLQMNCQNCGGLIKSPLLSEVQLFVCPRCKDIVEVKDVVISVEKTTDTFRPSLINLLISAKEKFQLNKSSKSQENQVIDKRLALLLRRDDFRLKIFYDFLVQIKSDTNKISSRLLNISSTGAAVEFLEQDHIPEADSEIEFQLLLPGHTKPLSLLARVVWSRKPAKGTISPFVTMGLHFKNTDQETRSCLWDFIVNAETSDRT
jgi:phage FluMu protein Com